MRVMKWSMIALAVAAGTSQFAVASSQDESKGFIDDSSLKLKTRFEYMNRDYKNGASNPSSGTAGYRQDSGLSQLLTYESGFTQGIVGFGLDAMAMGAVKLDGGSGKRGNGLFANDSDGNPEKSQGKVGGAVKLRLSDTVLKYGQQFVASPVFATDDSRMLPEVATGTLLTSKEIKGLEVSAGRFTALSKQTGMARDSIGGLTDEDGNHGKGLSDGINIFGASYAFTDNFSAAVAASDAEEYFKKYYVNMNLTVPINDEQSLNFDLNGYKTKGDKRGDLVDAIGDGTLGVDNNLWSLAAAYSLGAHKFTLAYQQSSGDNAYYYGVDGNSTIFVSNSIQISDFVGREEKSYQARYDLNMAQYGVPGLSFMTRYVMGDNIKTNGLGEGKENEWNLESKYVVQEGPAKDLSFRARFANYRSNGAYSGYSSDVYDTRLIIEYPLSIL
ncbi:MULTISPECIES: OprD family porin [Pseudomonas]|uniref:Outer membrane porin, OprD family n=1 Tax=Pseudomonas umsongensis TaxID=198618 RepID=A0ABX4DP86_9PSED|nr:MULTISPECIES: OprD family porin [Pseudomonas]EPA95898.1 outer membrane porin, OprD family [Pseudomonas sp. G5(2012)]OXR28602.1 outer membrane porin, OprD family [Pseudomonas umsongensis]SDT66551.1 imipenem/basic amino acid-specific outer membrane pore [Pseudomonas umsongensis]